MTLKELKRRHESGVKQMKSVRAQIRTQLVRSCAQRGCAISLAFRNKRAVLCDAHRGVPLANAVKTNSKKRPTRRITKAEQRRINRDKKRRFYERHGIKWDKTVRNRDYELPENSTGVKYAGQTLLYEHYKEPLKTIEKGKGFGYYGTLALTSDQEFVQCHICGNLFPSVSAHLRKHKVTAKKYKEMYGLAATTALVSEPVRKMQQARVMSNPLLAEIKANGLPAWLQEYNRKVQSGEVRHKAHGRTSMPLEKRNELGLCPDQVLARIKELADMLGHTPSEDEFRRHYKSRYIGAIRFQHGSYLAAVKKLGMKSAKELFQPTSEELLQDLRGFYERYGRIPMTSDFKRGLLHSRTTYFERFGSLNNARVEAGLNAVLPLPFGQKVELTPEQYREYRAQHAERTKR